ncbi:hypothetical protein Tco_0172752 [Tanacetum coccineum]
MATNYVANNHNKDGPGYYELMAWMDSRHNDKRINQMSKSTLCHAWVYGWGNDESADDIVSSNEEWEESDYGNPPNTNDDSFLEPYLDAHNKNTKQSERNHMKCNCDTSELEKAPHPNNMNDVQPNGRMCKAEKFEVAIRCILGFGIRRIDSLYRSCYKVINDLVYSGKRRVLNSYGNSDASSTHFCSRAQIEESS